MLPKETSDEFLFNIMEGQIHRIMTKTRQGYLKTDLKINILHLNGNWKYLSKHFFINLTVKISCNWKNSQKYFISATQHWKQKEQWKTNR